MMGAISVNSKVSSSVPQPLHARMHKHRSRQGARARRKARRQQPSQIINAGKLELPPKTVLDIEKSSNDKADLPNFSNTLCLTTEPQTSFQTGGSSDIETLYAMNNDVSLLPNSSTMEIACTNSINSPPTTIEVVNICATHECDTMSTNALTSITSSKQNQFNTVSTSSLEKLDLDPVDDSDPPDVYSCDTCYRIFISYEEFKEHDSYQFCCDECEICYSTQLEADLHELEKHADSVYAAKHIPESTKSYFNNKLRVSR